jgi:general secretion pathway protein N
MTRRNILILALLGLFTYLLFMLIQFPARTAWQWAPQELQNQLRVQGLEGSIWNGHVRQVWFQRYDLGRVDWQLSALGLVTGRLNLEFEIDASTIQATGEVSGSGSQAFTLTDLKAVIDPALLDTRLSPASLLGTLGMDIRSAEFVAGQILAIEGVASLGNGALAGPYSLPLGDVSAVLTPDGEETEISIENRNSPLSISGIVMLSADGQYELQFELRNTDPARQDLNDALSLLGRPDGNGRYQVGFRGQVPL